MKFCEECGAQLEDDAVFCEECGAQIKSETPPVQTDTLQKPEKEPSSKGRPIIIVFLLILIAVAGILGFTYFMKKSGQKANESDLSADRHTQSTNTAPGEDASASGQTTGNSDNTGPASAMEADKNPIPSPPTESPTPTTAETPTPEEENAAESSDTPVEVNSSNIKDYCGTWKNPEYNYLHLSIMPKDSKIYLIFEAEYSSGMHISSIETLVNDSYKISENTYQWNYTDSWGNQGILTIEFTTSGLYLTAEETFSYDGYSAATDRTLFRLSTPYDWDSDFYNHVPAQSYADEYSAYYDGLTEYNSVWVCDQYEDNGYICVIFEINQDGTTWIAQFENLNDDLRGYCLEGTFTYYPSTIIDSYPLCQITNATYYPIPEGVD